MGFMMSDLSDAHMADAKRWGAKLLKKPDRPLRKATSAFLKAEGSQERVRVQMGLETLGEARDMIGRELRIRTKETMG